MIRNDHWSHPGFAFPKPFIKIKFRGSPFRQRRLGEIIAGLSVEVPRTTEASEMKKTALALATVATIGVSALVAPSPAQAWRGGWGWGGGLAAGLIGAAVVGGIASSAYAYGPGYGYYGGPGYGIMAAAMPQRITAATPQRIMAATRQRTPTTATPPHTTADTGRVTMAGIGASFAPHTPTGRGYYRGYGYRW